VGTHATWATAHLFGWLGPSKAYLLGLEGVTAHFRHVPIRTMSSTGHEPTPRIFGGQVPLSQAGGLQTPTSRPVSSQDVSFRKAFLRRLVCSAYLLGLLLARTPGRNRSAVASGLLGLSLLLPGLSAATFRETPAVRVLSPQMILDPGESLRYRTRIGAEFARALSAAPRDGALAFFLNITPHGRAAVRVDVDGKELSLTDRRNNWSVREPGFVRTALGAGANLTVEIRNPSTARLAIGGWQVAGLPGREILRAPRPKPGLPGDALPSLEIRAAHQDGRLYLVGF
jgi:hypothetical protein